MTGCRLEVNVVFCIMSPALSRLEVIETRSLTSNIWHPDVSDLLTDTGDLIANDNR